MNAYELAKAQQAVNPAPTLGEIIQWQADRIAELEKELQALKIWTGTIQPTTPQTKPLSDERLQEIYKKVYEEGHDNQVVALCRVIEKEHGIL